MANICNNGLICYWAGTAAFRKNIDHSFLYLDLILCIMILYKNYIRILGSYVFIFIRECGCNYKVNVCIAVLDSWWVYLIGLIRSM